MRIIFFILFFVSVAEAKVSLGLNDVSVLLPLPTQEADIELLLTPQQGLISDKNLALLSPLVSDDNSVDRTKTLKAVAFRIDPCFNESTPLACRRQLRLIFQPLSVYQNSIFTLDAAVHAFYDFDETTWDLLLKEWRQTLSDGSPLTPLQIHPTIKVQGLRGPLWQRYRKIILNFCSNKNLTRLTQSTVDRFGMNWDFLGFDISPEGQITKIQIPRTNVTKQIFFSNGAGSKEFTAEILPPMSSTDRAWARFFDDSYRQPLDIQWEAVRRSFEFENPERFNTANLDCVSCHVSQAVRLWGENHFNEWPNDSVIQKNRFISRWNLDQSAKPVFFTNRVRAFGYFLDEPNISPRVINESALSAEALEKFLK